MEAGGLHTRNFYRSAALIGQFEFKYNFYGYRAFFEHIIRHFQYNCTSLKVLTYYLLCTYLCIYSPKAKYEILIVKSVFGPTITRTWTLLSQIMAVGMERNGNDRSLADYVGRHTCISCRN
jgi:hypothetical protein